VVRPRALGPRLLVFWALITLGPLMVGASFSLSGYLFAATKWLGVDDSGFGFIDVASVLPTLMIVAAFSVFYLIVPNRPVDARGALLGGVVAGVLFSLLRKVFGLYVASFPTYQTVYGAVSAVPIFLVWMYASWTVVLFGASITAAFGEWRSAGGRPGGDAVRPSQRLRAALAILAMLYKASLAGSVVKRGKLLRETGFGEASVDKLLVDLRAAHMIENSRRGWVLCRDISTVTLFDLYDALGFTVSEAEADASAPGWQGVVGERLNALRTAQQGELDVSLRALFADLFSESHMARKPETPPADPHRQPVNPLTGAEAQDENEPKIKSVGAAE
jgi:membrane protein